MAIKRKEKILPKIPKLPKIPDNESSFAKTIREREEKEATAIAKTKQDIIDAAIEKKRKESIIFPYLDNLKDQLKEKKTSSFWIFPDRSGFKKIRLNELAMIKMLKANPKKYANRVIVWFTMVIIHRHPDPQSLKKYGIHIAVKISINKLDKNAEFSEDAWGCDFVWKNDDFKLTKFTFKLIERIMEPIVARKKTCTSLVGIPVTMVIKDLEKMGYKFDDVLNPLAGV